MGKRLTDSLEALGRESEALGTGELVKALLENALTERASDIHLDPDSQGYQLRFRIDGTLTPGVHLSKQSGLRIVRACKTLADMEPGVARLPLDGRAEFELGDRSLGLRVATAPTVSGEKLTLRLLQAELTRLSLSELGLSTSDYEVVRQALHDARGMLLLSGPTGSGKTTALYAILHELRQTAQSIVTIEDPVEYVLDGVTQIQVQKKQGLTFAD
jgi:type II secretory ATPase GspE/PulE/Tfp pilus assembly ATPase PilB-like protein